MTVSEWTSILRLATKWAFTSMRELAIQRLFCITCPVEKIVLAHTFSIPDWLPKAYAELCKREAPLTVDEGRDLFDLGWTGCDIVIHLNQASYEWRKRVMYGTPANMDGEVAAIVKKVFQLGSEPSETVRGNGGQEAEPQRYELGDDESSRATSLMPIQPKKKKGKKGSFEFSWE
jgi:hypothetical protein